MKENMLDYGFFQRLSMFSSIGFSLVFSVWILAFPKVFISVSISLITSA